MPNFHKFNELTILILNRVFFKSNILEQIFFKACESLDNLKSMRIDERGGNKNNNNELFGFSGLVHYRIKSKQEIMTRTRFFGVFSIKGTYHYIYWRYFVKSKAMAVYMLKLLKVMNIRVERISLNHLDTSWQQSVYFNYINSSQSS